MNTSAKPILVFRAGHHTDMHGVSQVFTDADLQQTARAYAPKAHEAPLVVGHPQHDSPAFGWVQSLHFVGTPRGGELLAVPHQVDPTFAELVANGRYKKISASFYTPSSPSNPTPGVYYLRHIGLLGAQPPAVKGLPDASFGSMDDHQFITLEWSEPEPISSGSLWQRLREWLATTFNQETADRVLPAAMIDPREEPTETAPPPATPTPPATQEAVAGDQKNEETIARSIQQALAREKIRQALERFIQELTNEGHLLPFEGPNLLQFMSALPDETHLAFREPGDPVTGTVSQTPLDWFQGFLRRLPKQVEYAELAAPDQDPVPVSFTTAPGYQVDPGRLKLHQQAKAYATNHQVDYLSAVRKVQERSD